MTNSNAEHIGQTLKRALTGGLIFAILAVYGMIFVMSLLTVALLEIRQANSVNFNSLVATLELRDRFDKKFQDESLEQINQELKAYQDLIASNIVLMCPMRQTIKSAIPNRVTK